MSGRMNDKLQGLLGWWNFPKICETCERIRFARRYTVEILVTNRTRSAIWQEKAICWTLSATITNKVKLDYTVSMLMSPIHRLNSARWSDICLIFAPRSWLSWLNIYWGQWTVCSMRLYTPCNIQLHFRECIVILLASVLTATAIYTYV